MRASTSSRLLRSGRGLSGRRAVLASGRMAVLTSGRRAVLACLLVLTSVALAACGSSNSPDATTLLRQTFSGSHTVNSGNLGFALTLQPSGSSTVSGPISLSFAGPFQSQGKGKLPKSNFTVSVGAGGHTTSLAIISTGTAGYVSLGGSSYQLPAGTFQKLESSFGAIATSSGGSAGGSLGKLGINPLHWLQSPSVVGTESVGGTQTTHIVAGVNVTALLADLNTFLQKASSLGVSGSAKLPKGISSQTQSKIAGEIQNPRFNLWTGSNDKTVRKMSIDLTLPVSGSISTALGGLTSARISLVIKYDDLNQPQTITAPTSVRPFSEFSSQLQALLSGLGASGIAGGSSGAGSSSNGSGSSSSGAGSSSSGAGSSSSGAAVQKYSQCIQSAGQDVAKMQQCAALLGGK